MHCLLAVLIWLTAWTSAASAVYWVSPTGQADWKSAASATPLSGAAAASLTTANAHAVAGDVVVLRGGTYTLDHRRRDGIAPAHSGTAEKRITFQAHRGEQPLFTGFLELPARTRIIVLEQRSYITVHGMHGDEVNQFFLINNNAHHNEIAHCTFSNAVGAEPLRAARIGSASGARKSSGPSTHNWIHHNVMGRAGNVDARGEDRQGVLTVGELADMGTAGYNTIEHNVLFHGGHDVMGVNTDRNVIRNNIYYNDGWIDHPVSASRRRAQFTLGKARPEPGNVLVGVTSGARATVAYNTGAKTDGEFRVATGSFATADAAGSFVVTGQTGAFTAGEWLNVQGGAAKAMKITQDTAPAFTPDPNGRFGNRNLAVAVGMSNLIERNRIGHAGMSSDDGPLEGLTVSSPRNIIRFNCIFNSAGRGIFLKSLAYRGGSHGANNRIYHNTIFHNGHKMSP